MLSDNDISDIVKYACDHLIYYLLMPCLLVQRDVIISIVLNK